MLTQTHKKQLAQMEVDLKRIQGQLININHLSGEDTRLPWAADSLSDALSNIRIASKNLTFSDAK